MNDQELDNILKSARVPDRSQEDSENFAGRVQREVQRREKEGRRSAGLRPAGDGGVSPPIPLLSHALKPSLIFGFALACLTLVLAYSFWRPQRPFVPGDQLAAAGKYFREIHALFPNQLEVIAFDHDGAQLVLSERPDVPMSPPLYLKLCRGNQCCSFVTFSGQEIRLNGEAFQVLVDRQGAVMVVGQQWVWSSSAPGEKAGLYRIAARPLPMS